MSDQSRQEMDDMEHADKSHDPDALFDDPMAEEELEDHDETELEQEAPRSAGEIIAALNEENTELKNKVMNVLADMENLRRRTEREIKDARQYAVANFARDMLSVSDNMNRALQAISQDARDAADEAMKNLLEGVEMTDRDLQNQLSKNGVQQLDPKGEKFDPNFHQAMFEIPNPKLPNGTVVEVVQAGYKIGERVLRPAMVGIAKGGPKVVSQKEQTTNDEAGSKLDKSV